MAAATGQESLQISPESPTIRIQLFCPDPVTGWYSEERSVSSHVRPARWQDVRLPIQDGIPNGRLRLDPVDFPALIEITLLAIRGPSGSDFLWVMEPRDLDRLTIAGRAMRVPDERSLLLFSFGHDPQLLLPDNISAPVGSSLELRIRIATEREPA